MEPSKDSGQGVVWSEEEMTVHKKIKILSQIADKRFEQKEA